MAEHDTYWLRLAHKYAREHPAVRAVGSLVVDATGGGSFDAVFIVSLPGCFHAKGRTDRGVRRLEPVCFSFQPSFPFSQPLVSLRPDFDRSFPHINPNEKQVLPCIYEGQLGDLIQQPKWFDHILDQTADWLCKAAADDLMNLAQGWEPMRLSRSDGCFWYSAEDIRGLLERQDAFVLSSLSLWRNGMAFAGALGAPEKCATEEHRTLVFCHGTPRGSKGVRYVSSSVATFSDLHAFATRCGMAGMKRAIDKEIGNLAKNGRRQFWVLLGVQRPARIVGGQSDIELLTFVVQTAVNRKNGKVLMTTPVKQIAQANICTPTLLATCSGVTPREARAVMQIGCGSLGSKVAMHVARTGMARFALVDPAIFMPHNHARHAMTDDHAALFPHKVDLMAKSLRAMNVDAEAIATSIMDVPSLENRGGLLIDATASTAVRNYLARVRLKGRLATACLYGEGRMGVLAIEGENRHPRVDDVFCALYSEALSDPRVHAQIYTDRHESVPLGQGCDSITVKCPDSRISLTAAGMASELQKVLAGPYPKDGALFIGHVGQDEMSLSWRKVVVGAPTVVAAASEDDWEVRILPDVVDQMSHSAHESAPNETGGVLIGHVSVTLRCLSITGLLPPPEDSRRDRGYFELGIKGLCEKVRVITEHTNGALTYLGTWHSHPQGGGASEIDADTKARLLVLRDYEPTVCLIWQKGGIIRV